MNEGRRRLDRLDGVNCWFGWVFRRVGILLESNIGKYHHSKSLLGIPLPKGTKEDQENTGTQRKIQRKI
jgi:hypothetical protein